MAKMIPYTIEVWVHKAYTEIIKLYDHAQLWEKRLYEKNWIL